ncbi:MAG: sigma-70 family RNA polymerase sigma factor [Bacteroidetes bacterium]|nr:sigma-70 family RNA polymerase sigma factor [Bacteroidota bacterium]
MTEEFSDNELLEKFRQEDTRHYAFNLLVRKYQQRLYWHVRRMVVDHDDANDIMQNVFIKVWKALDNFRSDSQLYTWLYRIATNESITFLNSKKKRFTISFDDVENELADKLITDPLFTGDKIQLKLQQAVLRLPPQQRLVFNMKYFDGLKYEEISEILNVSVGGLKASYHHAVKKIENFITGN